MVWVRIDDHFDEHPKIAGLDDHAFAMFVAGLAYCNRNLTDGFIPTAIGMGKLRWCEGKPRKAIAALETAGLWEPFDGGWLVHDFDDYQPTKQQVDDEHSKKQAAGQAGGRAAAQARASTNGVAPALAKPKPGPGPGPGPGKTKKDSSESLSASTDVTGSEEPSPGDDRVDEVYAEYKARIQPKARLCPRKQIASRLKRFSVAELKQGIDHFAGDPWWMEHNADKGAGWFFESDARSEQFLLMHPRASKNITPIHGDRLTREQAEAEFGWMKDANA